MEFSQVEFTGHGSDLDQLYIWHSDAAPIVPIFPSSFFLPYIVSLLSEYEGQTVRTDTLLAMHESAEIAVGYRAFRLVVRSLSLFCKQQR